MRRRSSKKVGTKIAGMRVDAGRLPEEAAAVGVGVVVEDSVGLVPESVTDAVITGKAELDKDNREDDDVDDVDDVDGELDGIEDDEKALLVRVDESGKDVDGEEEAGEVGPPNDQPSPSGIDGP